MSDYISKKETIETIWNTFNSYGNNASVFDLEETYVIKKFCSRLQREIELLPTLDEKEIIRKVFERVVEKLEELKQNAFDDESVIISDAIEIVKEECGISE